MNRQMNRQRLVFLFLSNLVILIGAAGMIPLVPVRALALGASASAAGGLMAGAYVAVLLGTLAAGRLAGRSLTSSRAFFQLAVAGTMLGFYLAAKATTIAPYTAGILLAWFTGGFQVVMINIHAGLNAGTQNRGRIFALIHTAGPLGTVIGGFSSGRVVDAYGYETLFIITAIAQLLLLPLSSIAFDAGVKFRPTTTAAGGSEAATTGALPLAFWTLFVALLLATIAVVFGRLGTSLLMERLNFSASAISGVAAAGGLVTIPLLPLIGALSDRRRSGHSYFLAISFLLALAGLLLLRHAAGLWQFTAASGALIFGTSTLGTLSSARAATLVPRRHLPRALSLINSTTWVAFIIGFAAGGYLLEHWSPAILYLAAALLPLTALLLLAASERVATHHPTFAVDTLLDAPVDREETADSYAAGS